MKPIKNSMTRKIQLKQTYISDGFLGLLFSISGFLDTVVHLTLDLDQVSLKLLLCVQEACILKYMSMFASNYDV